MEINYLMSLDESGVVMFDDEGEAMANNIQEWMDTPRGQVYGNPDWGHDFNSFRHEPHNETTAIGLENMILNGLPRDVQGVKIYSILCNPDTSVMDQYNVNIVTNAGAISTQLNV